MPELPEVTTTVRGLNETVQGLRIIDVWSDLPKDDHVKTNEIKNSAFWKRFKSIAKNSTISHAERRGKNILIHLDNGNTILIHMKMTGHLLCGTYKKLTAKEQVRLGVSKDWTWWPEEETLRDPYNRFIHLVFTLSNGKHLVFCDTRKFGKVTYEETHTINETIHLSHLGPDALDPTLTFSQFQKQLMMRPTWEIKTTLMEQSCITGIGNIYSDELLWLAGIHPLTHVTQIPQKEMKRMFTLMHPLLEKGISLGGDSTSDYRNIYGEHGSFHHAHNAYQKTGTKCSKRGCNGTIKRIVVKGRSTHFCDTHQTLFTK